MTEASSRRMRVLHLGKYYPPDRGGIETYLQSLCRSLSPDLDIDVLVANSGNTTLSEVRDGANITRLARVAVLAGAPICPRLPAELRNRTQDIVHLHVPNPTATLAYLMSGIGGKLVISYHSDVIRQKILGRVFEPIMQRALKRADAIIVASPQYMESSPSLSPHLGRCRVIPYGINVEKLAGEEPDPGAAEIRRRYPGNIVLAVGRLTAYKGFEFLIEAAAHFDGHVLVVGEGDARPQLARAIAARGLSNRVHLLGNVPDTKPYYQAADVFVLPSVERSEAFGIVQVEAMARAVPIVNTNLRSGVTFVSVGGETGLTVAPRDPRALGAAIDHLLKHPEERRRLGQAGKERAAKLFDAAAMARETLRLYREIAGF